MTEANSAVSALRLDPAAGIPPRAARRPAETTFHGDTRADEYAWLRSAEWRTVMRDPSALEPDIRTHLDAENAYCEAVLAPLTGLRQTLVAELRGRIREDDSSVPAPDGPYAYAMRYREGGEHPLVVRTPRAGGPEETLLDGDALAAGKSYFRLAAADHSPDHSLLLYGSDETGGEVFTLRVRDLAFGADTGDVVTDTSGDAVWEADSRAFLYVRLDEEHRPAAVYRHVLGTPAETDSLIYAEADPGFFVSVGETQSGRFLSVDVHDHETSESWLIDQQDPERRLVLVAPRVTAETYSIDHGGGDSFVILTNAGDAEDYKLVTAPVSDPGRETWRDLVAHRPGCLILSHTAFAGHIVRLEREGGLPRIVVRRIEDGAEHAIAFAEEAYSLGMSGGYEADTTTLRFTYSSMTTPAQVYDYDMEARTRVLRKEQEVPSGHDPALYVTRRLEAVAPDGETVPVSVLHRRDIALDGSAPCLLYGYGAYGISIPASFSTNALSLVDRGFVYAIAHVRGGKDKGFRWYKAGRREAKVNTFTDFIAVARHLAALGFTAPGRIVAQGGSAGGMLMGAVANMAPDMFGGIIAEVPFVDVLNTMLDATLPLTPPEWPEWGNPIEDAEAYRRIKAYSPYDGVSAQAYPAILALAGLTDPRVTYWEPAKWVARLRAAKTDANPLLLRTNMDAGHGGAAGRFARLEEVALVQAFALAVTGRA
ncbi:oligopeptidase B [Pseudoxanthobacter soli DSM 19599]|uniref:Oligopeptidase B n=1 Tax=Pseudoxanthobacter soli DSM 19599 TaxID=1123029 RepID=A0A1M7ZN16_9HYPH|nr:S9 family peptidase [Pseudoxanthobacter soli]SHO66199.1 oligopeptidase B [Pseudoxanthobacter soli DSM 19599]